jgi:hypothetical protein
MKKAATIAGEQLTKARFQVGWSVKWYLVNWHASYQRCARANKDRASVIAQFA